MLSTGTFPDRLKFSEVKPIYKKVDKTLITNYRPISLLPVFSKIFEKIIYKSLYHHLTSNSILVMEQFGFRCNNSTEIAIYTLINNILSSFYLRNRYQRVVINAHNNSNGYFSKWEEIQHGVPQGSVLGPLLFLIYVNDVSKSVSDKSSPILFVDDTSFIIANRDETKFKFNTNEIFN